jgi:hypothetical protein
MIQAPGLNNPKDAPGWLADIQLCLEFGWTEEQCDGTSIEFKRRAMTYLRGRARGEEQRARRERMKK